MDDMLSQASQPRAEPQGQVRDRETRSEDQPGPLGVGSYTPVRSETDDSRQHKQFNTNSISESLENVPLIVVTGDQGTGKSCLVEGLCSTKLFLRNRQRFRCPVEVNLQASETKWSCRILIVTRYGYKMPVVESQETTSLGPYNIELPEVTINHFTNVVDQVDIPFWVAQAQRAVLNPSQDSKTFAVKPEGTVNDSINEESFSPNMVRVEIRGEGLPCISVLDLPGVITVDDNPDIPRILHKLVEINVRNVNALILLTLSVEQDSRCSSALALVHEVQAQQRTIGVITKADRLIASRTNHWQMLLAGSMFPLKLGYSVVMRTANSNNSLEAILQDEKLFFDTDHCFTQDFAGFKDRFGIESLRRTILLQYGSLHEQFPASLLLE